MALTFGDLGGIDFTPGSNPFLHQQANPFLPRRPAAAPAGPALLPGEESSVLGNLMEGGLGGLAYVGKVLDKTFGGRAVRGVLGGHYGELASVLPFSDTLGITDEKNIVHGEDLLRDAGLIDQGDTSLPATLAGVGAEIALDPAMFLTPFGLGNAVPKLTAKLGLGASRGLGRGVAAFTGFNPHTAAANALAAAADKALPPVRALFDPGVFGSHIGEVQRKVAPVYGDTLEQGRAAARGDEADSLVRLRDYAKSSPSAQGVINRALTQAGEGLTDAAEQTLLSGGFSPNPAAIQDILGIGAELRTQARGTLGRERNAGLLSKDLVDLPEWKIKANEEAVANGLPEPYKPEAEYLPRTLAPYPGSDQPFGRTLHTQLGSGNEFQIGRDDFLRGIPGGTEALNTFARDANLSGSTRAFTPDQAEAFFASHIMGQPVSAIDRSHPVWGQAKKLSDFFENLRPEALTNGLFNTDAVGNVLARQMESARSVAGARAAMKTLDPATGFIKPAQTFEQTGQPFVRVPEFLDSAMLKHTDPLTGMPAAREQVANLLGIDTTNPLWQKDLAHWAIPKDVAVDVLRMGQAWTMPETLKPLIGVWDSFVNLFKASLTAPFPGFHFRNLMSGVFNMWRDGVNPAEQLAAGGDMLRVIRGGQLSPEAAARLYPGLPPQQATDEFLKELLANNLAFRRGGITSDRVGDVPAFAGGMLAKDVPTVGAAELRPVGGDLAELGNMAAGRAGGTSWGDALNPMKGFGVAGVAGNVGDANPLVAAGRAIGNTTEDWVRGTHYLAKRLEGVTPADAKISTLKYQIDYSALTPFEKEVMKRFFPWYTFSRRNLPPLLEDVATKPALLAGAVRGATGTRTEGEFVPPWIAEGSSVRIPGAPEGNLRFISSFGLPFEDEAIKTIGAGMQGDPRRFFQQVFGMSQPFVKLPAELATGTQMFSGRRLEDLRPYEFSSLGGLLPEDKARALSQVVANSPASRFFSSADKFLDERKPTLATLLNLGTGVRVTDVEEGKVKERAASDLLRQMLRGHPGVRSRDDVYVPRDQLQSLRPEDLALYDLLKEIESRQAARGRAAARERAAPGR